MAPLEGGDAAITYELQIQALPRWWGHGTPISHDISRPPVDVGHGVRYRITPTRINRRQEDLSSTLILPLSYSCPFLSFCFREVTVSEERYLTRINPWTRGRWFRSGENDPGISRFLTINFRSWILSLDYVDVWKRMILIASIISVFFGAEIEER